MTNRMIEEELNELHRIGVLSKAKLKRCLAVLEKEDMGEYECMSVSETADMIIALA